MALRQELSTEQEERFNTALAAYLDAAENGRPALREELLRQHPDLADELAAFLDAEQSLHHLATPFRQLTPDPTRGRPALLPHILETDSLGDFRLVREIGRGGMGVVYEAQQLSLRRRVALKVLPFAAVLDPRQFQRFQNEAQAAACLHHNHIVPIFAVGCERGVHYYAMQYIEGQTLAALIDELHQNDECRSTNDERRTNAEARMTKPVAPTVEAAGATTRHSSFDILSSLGIRHSAFFQTVAQWGIQAADALDHAHRTGIVHRDIKPANLMIDGHSQLWVTDFGLAHMQGETRLTMTGDLVGTFRYMSPEQASGRPGVDHRTDVYSLGATLYELLTLKPVLDGKNRQELLRQIDLEESVPARRHNPTIPTDLETILLKALAKNPEERYGTARDLAEDLRRFLDHRPILARRPTPAQRLWKWARRHPSLVAAGFGLLFLVAVSSLVSTALIQAEQGKTEAAYERERKRAEEAEARFRLAKRSVDEMIQFSEEELADKPTGWGLRKRLLHSALIYYQEFIDQRQGDPAAQEELRETKTRVEKILADLAVLQGAGRLLLLSQPVVLEELRLSDEQRKRCGDLGGQWLKMLLEFRRLPPPELYKRFVEQARADDAVINATLRPEQVRRLQQIMVQAQGLAAFREPEVATALKLTADQRERIRAIETETLLGMLDWIRPGGLPEDMRKARDQKTRAGLERVLTVLTSDQARAWTAMTGEPFTGQVWSGFGDLFGPGRAGLRPGLP